MAKLKSVLIYPGAKRRLAKRVVDAFEPVMSKGDFTYVELCVGSGDVLLEVVSRKMPTRIVVNDRAVHTASFWKCVASEELTEALIERVKQADAMKPKQLRKEHVRLKPLLESPDALEAGYAAVIRHRLAFGGFAGSDWSVGGKMPDDDETELHRRLGATETCRRIRALHKAIGSRLEVRNCDAAEILKEYDRAKTIVYIDPPYLSIQQETNISADDSTGGMYLQEMDDSTHEDIADAAASMRKAFVAVSYNSHPWIREVLYDWAAIEEVPVTYGLRSSGRARVTEVLITNQVTGKRRTRASRKARQKKLLKEHEAVLNRCEGVFRDEGAALDRIRDLRLYSPPHSTFEDYLTMERGYGSRDYAYKIMRAARVARNVDNLATSKEKPRNEAQVRPLTVLKKPEQQAKAWDAAVRKKPAKAKRTSGKLVAEVVEKLLKRKPTPDEQEALGYKHIIPRPPSLLQAAIDIDTMLKYARDELTERWEWWDLTPEEVEQSQIFFGALAEELEAFASDITQYPQEPDDVTSNLDLPSSTESDL